MTEFESNRLFNNLTVNVETIYLPKACCYLSSVDAVSS
jgi:hypothetical protein